jgi:hypothetical protein
MSLMPRRCLTRRWPPNRRRHGVGLLKGESAPFAAEQQILLASKLNSFNQKFSADPPTGILPESSFYQQSDSR